LFKNGGPFHFRARISTTTQASVRIEHPPLLTLYVPNIRKIIFKNHYFMRKLDHDGGTEARAI
jgi:hypothetical protein